MKAEPTFVLVLTYHSISSDQGPTCIPPPVFREQLQSLEKNDFQVISLADFVDWRNGQRELPARCSVITFDDGYEDFAQQAFPALKEKGWAATVFLPTDSVGGHEDWPGHNVPPRALMTWSTVRELADQGIDFGSHARTHRALTSVPFAAACAEIRLSKQIIEERLARSSVLAFAPPYGRSNVAVREEISKWYSLSVTTKLAQAGRDCDLYAVPRIEMHYFRDPRRWNAFLDGRGELYLRARRIVRGVGRWLRKGQADVH